MSRRAFFAGAASAVVLAIIPLPVDPVDRFIADLKAEGIWHKFDRIWILTTVDGQTFVNARGK